MKFYEIPDSLESEIDKLDTIIEDYRKEKITATEVKAHRVPFGVYEQRKDDTYMVRIRCTGGGITPAQLAVVADLSTRYGRDSLHITTRQEIQIHNVELGNIIKIIKELKKAGLATRGGGGNTVRNIMASWDSGISANEVFDVTPYAVELTSRLMEESDSWTLPRKYKIAFSNSPSDNAQSTFNDLGFIAQLRDGVKGFRVYVAGGMGAKPQLGKLLYDFIPADQTYLIAASVKNLFSKYGNRKNKHTARLRFLWNKLGEDTFIEYFNQELIELKNQGIKPFEVNEIENVAPPSIPLEPILLNSDDYNLWRQRYVLEQKQPRLYSILLPVFLGDIPNETAKRLAEFLSDFGENVLRFTMQQNISIRNIPGEYLVNMYKTANTLSEQSDKPSFISKAIACTGANTCKLGICLPQGAIRAINEKLGKADFDLDSVENVRLNISGCPNTCGQHMLADIGFYGKVARKDQAMYPAYTIVAGAKIGYDDFRFARKVGNISARDIPDFITGLLSAYSRNKDSFSSFHEYIDSIGEEDIRKICAKYHDIPAFQNDKNYYFDWGSDSVFSLVGRGIGECSAGLFDLINVDRDRIKALRKSMDNESDVDTVADMLYQVALCSARMLLITRGAEVPTDRETFEAFHKHFIDAGLVDETYADIIEHAKKRDLTVLAKLKDRILSFADDIEQLYENMDDSLRFPVETERSESSSSEKGSEEEIENSLFRDYRGVACPMNFVKVKIDLSTMAARENMRIFLDDGQPIENVPRSVEEEGHEILSQVKKDDYWEVVIRKKV